MSAKPKRDPELDVWRQNIAEELRAFFARERLVKADAARYLAEARRLDEPAYRRDHGGCEEGPDKPLFVAQRRA